MNTAALALLAEQARGTMFGFYDMFSGGNLSQVTIFALGVMPYISASIILQLLTVVWPYLERLSKEGELGRRKITQYTRYLTVVLAVAQAMAIAVYLERQTNIAGGLPLVYEPGWGFRLMCVLTLTTGTMFVMWLGEQITERGIGNGMSLLIFAGIVVNFPRAVTLTFDQLRTGQIGLIRLLLLVALMVAVVAAIIFVERGQRRIVVQYAKRVVGRRQFAGTSTHIPLKVNTGGVIPVIFASSLLAFPATLTGLLPGRRLGRRGGAAAGLRHAALQPAVRQPDPVLRLLLHGDHLQSRRRLGEHAQVRRLHPRHPPGQAHRRAHRHDPDPDHAGRRRLPVPDRHPAGVHDHRLPGGADSRSSANGSTPTCPTGSPTAWA